MAAILAALVVFVREHRYLRPSIWLPRGPGGRRGPTQREIRLRAGPAALVKPRGRVHGFKRGSSEAIHRPSTDASMAARRTCCDGSRDSRAALAPRSARED